MIPMNRISPFFRTLAVLGALWLLVPTVGAKLSEPDHIFYGRVLRGGEPVAVGTVAIFLEGETTALATYEIGSDAELGQRYVLRIPIDSVEPQKVGTARPGDSVTLTVDGILAGEGTVGERGEVQLLDLDELAVFPGMTVDDVSLVEGDTGSLDATFTITLSETSLSEVTVDYETPTDEGSAIPGVDYTTVSDTATIAPGNLTATVLVPILGDFEEEADEDFLVRLSNVSGAILSDGEGVGTISDNERPPDVVISDAAVLEGDVGTTSVELTLTMSRPLAQTVSVQWTTSEAPGEATSGVDFGPAAGTAVFGVASTSTTLNVDVFGDVEDETDELFHVDLLSISPEATIQDAQAEVVIWDDDGFIEYIEGVGLGTIPGLDEASAVAVQPAGNWAFATGKVNDTLLSFARDGIDGSLTFADQISEGDDGGAVTGLDGPEDIVVSPDGAFVYVASFASSAVAVFAVDGGTGALTFVESLTDGDGLVDGLLGASSLALDPTGDYLYVAGESDDSIAVFDRDGGTGALTFVAAYFDNDEPVDGLGLDGATSVAVSADGAHVYVASRVESAVSAFDRDGGTGELTFVESQLRSAPITGLGGASSVAVSSDGAYVYATGAAEDSLVVFSRDDVTGALTWSQTLVDGVSGAEGLDGVTEVAVAFDTRVIFTAALEDDAIGVFARDPNTGVLSPVEFHFDGSGGEDGLDRAVDVAISVDDSSIYLVGSNDDAVAVYYRDSIPPSDPLTLVSTTHTPGVWSNLSQISMEWSGAVDNVGGSGVLGYSFHFDLIPTDLPDLVIDLGQGVDPHTTQSTFLPDDTGYYFHLRTCDFGANCTSTLHRGPYLIDVSAPSTPTSVVSPSHGGGGPVGDDTIDVTWVASNDNLSGVAGYSAVFDGKAANTCTETQNIGVVATVTSDPLEDATWYFHLCAVDEAGNWSDPVTLGPLVVEATPPSVLGVDTVAGTGDGTLAVDEIVETYGLTQLLFGFSELMEDGAGDSDPNDVTNPANYLLVEGGSDGAVDTAGCGALAGDDQAVSVDSVGFDSVTLLANAVVNGGAPINTGVYRVFLCSSLVDFYGNSLDGDANGTGGDDFSLSFEVRLDHLLANPNFDGDFSGWIRFPDDASVVDYSTEDADLADVSGSTNITFSGLDPTAYLSQCVTLVGSTFEVRGLARVDGGTATLPVISALIRYYASADCTVDLLGEESSGMVEGDTAGLWESFELAPLNLPAGALSSRVFFIVDGTGSTTYEAFLDNLVYGSETDLEIFADGFESGDTSAWSSVSP